eukprot:gene3741-4149_t
MPSIIQFVDAIRNVKSFEWGNDGQLVLHCECHGLPMSLSLDGVTDDALAYADIVQMLTRTCDELTHCQTQILHLDQLVADKDRELNMNRVALDDALKSSNGPASTGHAISSQTKPRSATVKVSCYPALSLLFAHYWQS